MGVSLAPVPFSDQHIHKWCRKPVWRDHRERYGSTMKGLKVSVRALICH